MYTVVGNVLYPEMNAVWQCVSFMEHILIHCHCTLFVSFFLFSFDCQWMSTSNVKMESLQLPVVLKRLRQLPVTRKTRPKTLLRRNPLAKRPRQTMPKVLRRELPVEKLFVIHCLCMNFVKDMWKFLKSEYEVQNGLGRINCYIRQEYYHL